MKDMLILPGHLLTTTPKVLEPGGAKTIVAESLLMQQHLIINRTRQRAQNLSVLPVGIERGEHLFREGLDPCRVGARRQGHQAVRERLRHGFLQRPRQAARGEVVDRRDPLVGGRRLQCHALLGESRPAVG